MLITAGPTFEPIDAVRYIGNRSSGRLGIALALEAARRGWVTDLLLGPVGLQIPSESGIHIQRFQTTAELSALLTAHAPAARVIIMAAAVADFRPRNSALANKIPRGGPLTLELEPTPDLLAGLAQKRPPGQLLVGFALQPREGLLGAAREKLIRKGVDMIVANPLETMDSTSIEAIILTRHGGEHRTRGDGGHSITKEQFAPWLLDLVEHHLAADTQAQKQGS